LHIVNRGKKEKVKTTVRTVSGVFENGQKKMVLNIQAQMEKRYKISAGGRMKQRARPKVYVEISFARGGKMDLEGGGGGGGGGGGERTEPKKGARPSISTEPQRSLGGWANCFAEKK